MIKLKNVTKNYVSGELVVKALKGVNIKFRESEFVAILGPSGCGKTTLLNIMGGLDQYTTGDLEIDGVSTVNYKDRDWDDYRNNSVGFVFQSYNLIMHQSVLANVELALTLSGIKKAERRARAKEALIKVGLEKEINKMPNQLSGGQMQRVAIARAIVNNPKIILADEPTGALDTDTSVQVMEILKEISKDRLVVMVTHNPELADKYANRIISMSDGLILKDTNSIPENEERKIEELVKEKKQVSKEEKKRKKAKMSIWTAFSLSLKNLFTKKFRTILTSIAGSIGIIGIALILSVSSGFQNYIDTVESGTLSSQAITLSTQQFDLTGALTSLMAGSSNKNKEKRPNKNEIYADTATESLVSSVSNMYTSADLTGFNYYLQNNLASEKLHGFRYNYGVNPIRFYGRNKFIQDYDVDYIGSKDYKLLFPYDVTRLNKGGVSLSAPKIEDLLGEDGDLMSYIVSMYSGFNPFSTPLLTNNDGELQDNWDLVQDQYELLASYKGYDLSSGLKENQMLLVIDEYNQIPDSVLFSLGLRGEDSLIYAMLDGFATAGGLEKVLGEYLPNVLKNDTASRLGISEEELAKYKDNYNKIVDRRNQPKKDASGNVMYDSTGTPILLYNTWRDYFAENEQGKADKDSLLQIMVHLCFGYEYDSERNSRPITFDEIMELNTCGEGRTSGYKVMANADEFYVENGVVKRYDKYKINDFIQSKDSRIMDIEIVGIARLKAGETYGSLSTGLVYSNKLLEKLFSATDSHEVVREVNMLNAEAFKEGTTYYNKYKDAFGVNGVLDRNAIVSALQMPTYVNLYDNKGQVVASNIRYVKEISLYASSFENKDYIINFIEDFNDKVESGTAYGDKVEYSDLMGKLFESVDIILNAITYVLVAFVGISLIVSSIMIGIITYISVLERTKEIGVLRSIGASKGDVGRVFNAETFIIGGVSGLFGVIFSAIITIPIRLILKQITGVLIPVALPFVGAVLLVIVSISLTLIAGLIPSRVASKKDPVVALRSE